MTDIQSIYTSAALRGNIMPEIDSKMPNNKKSRKSKAPVPFYRSPNKTSPPPPSSSASIMNNNTPSSSPPNDMVFRNGPAPPGTPGGVKSYSDFMRSLAAKYNNNEYFTPTSSAMPDLSNRFNNGNHLLKPPSNPSSPPNASAAAAAAAAAALLGFPPHFPFPGIGLPGSGLPMSMDKDPNPSSPNNNNNNNPSISMASTQALLNLAARSNVAEPIKSPKVVRSAVPDSPLDLTPLAKRSKIDAKEDHPSVLLSWSVSEVVNFVSGIDICREYAEVFREHNIDGSSLPLLTEDHLTLRLGLKLGPALKLRSLISRKLGGNEICARCAHCHESGNFFENGLSSETHQGQINNNHLSGDSRRSLSPPESSRISTPDGKIEDKISSS